MVHSLTMLAATALDSSSPYGYGANTGEGLPGWAIVLYIIVGILSIVAMWKVFKKAGRPGWASIVPFYNYWVLSEIAGRPGWFGLVALLLAFIPFVGWIAAIIMLGLISVDIARKFHKSAAFGIIGLLIFGFIGYLILGFGKAQYDSKASGSGIIEDTKYPSN